MINVQIEPIVLTECVFALKDIPAMALFVHTIVPMNMHGMVTLVYPLYQPMKMKVRQICIYRRNLLSTLYHSSAEVAPFCEITGCTCPTGYELIEYAVGQTCRVLPAEDVENETESEGLPCDIENNCSPYAQCEWVESELRNKCVCNPQYEGNGYVCTEVEVSCIYVSFPVCDE